VCRVVSCRVVLCCAMCNVNVQCAMSMSAFAVCRVPITILHLCDSRYLDDNGIRVRKQTDAIAPIILGNRVSLKDFIDAKGSRAVCGFQEFLCVDDVPAYQIGKGGLAGRGFTHRADRVAVAVAVDGYVSCSAGRTTKAALVWVIVLEPRAALLLGTIFAGILKVAII